MLAALGYQQKELEVCVQLQDMNVKGSHGCSNHEVVEFRLLRGRSKAKSKITSLDFRRADYGFSKDLLVRVLWDSESLPPPSSGAVHPKSRK